MSPPYRFLGILLWWCLRTLQFLFQTIGSGSTAMRSLRPIATPGVIFMSATTLLSL
ncbi:unnamed protein product [Brassica oleracea]